MSIYDYLDGLLYAAGEGTVFRITCENRLDKSLTFEAKNGPFEFSLASFIAEIQTHNNSEKLRNELKVKFPQVFI